MNADQLPHISEWTLPWKLVWSHVDVMLQQSPKQLATLDTAPLILTAAAAGPGEDEGEAGSLWAHAWPGQG